MLLFSFIDNNAIYWLNFCRAFGGGLINGSTLLISSSQKNIDIISELIRSEFPMNITTASSSSQARRLLSSSDYGIIIVNAPLPDEYGCDIAVFAAQQTHAGVILLVRADSSNQTEEIVEPSGVFVVHKPISRQVFFQTMRLSLSVSRRMAQLGDENARLQRKIEEVRLMGRAKCELVRHRGMTEQEAHRYLEKQAMDQRLSKRDISLKILEMYS